MALRLSFTSSVVDRSTNNGSHTARSGNGAGVVPASPPSSSSLPSDATTTVSLSSTVIAALESTSCYQSSACMPIGVGSIFGMGTFFLRKPVIPLITTVVSSSSNNTAAVVVTTVTPYTASLISLYYYSITAGHIAWYNRLFPLGCP